MTDNQRIEKILRAIDDQKDYSLIEKLDFVATFQKESAFKNFIQVLLVLIEKSRFHESASSLLLKKIYNQRIYKEEKDTEEYGIYLIEIIKEKAIHPYINISTALRRLLSTIIYNKEDDQLPGISFITPRSLLLQTNEYFLGKYLQVSGIDNLALSLYYNCVSDIDNNTNEITISDAASDLLRKTMDTDDQFIDYLKIFVRPYYSATTSGFPGEYFHVPEPFYRQIFNDSATFINKLEKTVKEDPKDRMLINEIKEFMKTFEQNKNKNVDFVRIPEDMDLHSPLHYNAKLQRNRTDGKLITITEPWDLSFWQNKFGVTREALIEAINHVGNNSKNVEEYLREHS